MVEQLQFLKQHLPVLVMEANQKASSIFAQYEYDVLDMHYYMISQTQGPIIYFIEGRSNQTCTSQRLKLSCFCDLPDVVWPKIDQKSQN